jgi:hypothetical protein
VSGMASAGPFHGLLKVRMPAGDQPGAPYACWRTQFFTEAGQPVLTIERAVIHLDVAEVAWADLTMFADADDRPVLDAPCDIAGLVEDGPDGEWIRTRTFRYLIEFVSERPAPAEKSEAAA